MILPFKEMSEVELVQPHAPGPWPYKMNIQMTLHPGQVSGI